MPLLSIEHFEHLVQSRQYEAAGNALFALLYSLDNHAGAMDGISGHAPAALSPAQRELHQGERIAGATSRLFVDEAFTLSAQGFSQLMCVQRWLSLIYGCTAQRNADHVIRTLCGVGSRFDETQNLIMDFAIPDVQLTKCLFLMTVESELPLQLDQLWEQNQTLAATLFFAWLSTNVMASPAAHQKREALLAWWPSRMNEATDFASWPLPVIHQVYMLCSYGFLDGRHEIKKSLNKLIRQHLLARGLGDVALMSLPEMGTAKSKALAKLATRLKSKPVLLVVTEWFSPGFAVYRTHSMTLRALKDKFHLVGVGPAAGANEVGRAVFDEFHATPASGVLDDVAFVRELASRLKPDIAYHLGVGMFPHTVYLSNIRLAPIQVVSNGHSATTHSPCIDYFLTDEGYISSPAAFSETLLPMPSGVMQMTPSVDIPATLLQQVNRTPRAASNLVKVKVAVAAAIIKMNPVFLNLLRNIALQAESQNLRVEYHFLMAQAVGPLYHRIRAEIEAVVGMQTDGLTQRAFVYPHQKYPAYMQIIGNCDLFLNPLPYGNMNGIADMALLGMPGICKVGPELAEHIDAGMFRQMGLPEWCIADSLETYMQAALRLICNHAERLDLSHQMIERKAHLSFYDNQKPAVMGEILLKLCRG